MIKIEKLTINQLEDIQGGAAVTISTGVWIGLIVSTIVVFLSGVIEGITNPEKCKG